MSESLAVAKQDLRQRMLEKLQSLPGEEKDQASKDLFDRLNKHPAFQHARVLMLYAALPTEISLTECFKLAWKAGKIIVLPRAEGQVLKPCRISNMETDLIAGPHRALEPRSGCKVIETDRLDLVVVPGLAYDRLGARLGRGKGFYDRFIRSLPETCHTLGVCFKIQLLRSIPTGPNDTCVKEVIAV